MSACKWVGVNGSASVNATVCGCAVLLVISLFHIVPYCSYQGVSVCIPSTFLLQRETPEVPISEPGETPLHKAVKGNHHRVAQLLIQNGVFLLICVSRSEPMWSVMHHMLYYYVTTWSFAPQVHSSFPWLSSLVHAVL